MGGGTQRKGGRVQKESQREDQGYHHATPREAKRTLLPRDGGGGTPAQIWGRALFVGLLVKAQFWGPGPRAHSSRLDARAPEGGSPVYSQTGGTC